MTARAASRLVLLALAAAAAVAPHARAAEPPDRARLRALQAEIAQLSAERQRLAAEEQGVLGRIETLGADARLLDARLEALTLQKRELDLTLANLDERGADVARRIEAGRARLRTIVQLLYQSGPLGHVRFMLGGGDTRDIAAGWRLAHELTARQREEVRRVRADERELATVREQGQARRAELAALVAEVATARAQLATAIRERQRLLASIRQQESQRAAAIDELQRASRELGQMLGTGQAPSLDLDVRRFRGLLQRPARGRLLEGFGMRRDARFGTVIPHHGWNIDAPYGAEVRAVFDGRVAWAANFRGYGLMVVVDHGSGVHSVYAHLSAVMIAKGNEVQRGQVIGRVGDTGSLTGPQLYFEIREGGKAQDPASWIRP